MISSNIHPDLVTNANSCKNKKSMLIIKASEWHQAMNQSITP
jgi:hypothetical protein